MKLGLSSYSINSEILAGKMDLPGAIKWIKEQGADCVELVPFSFTFVHEDGSINHEMIQTAKKAAKVNNIEIANYSILADLLKEDKKDLETEIERVKTHVAIAAQLGIPRMRHDVSAFRRPRGKNGVADFEKLFNQMIYAINHISDYGKTLGVTTLLENHGFFVNGCDRCERLIRAVDNDNYKMLLDTGNIACVDEDPSVAAMKLAPFCDMIHLKDFYIRKKDPGDASDFDCTGSWFQSNAGRYLRGSILGQGDLDIYEILSVIKASGYQGHIAIEFEGLEDPLYASRVSLNNARRIWEQV